MKRILIVDDAVTVRMYHRELMESLNYEVEEAENGIEALEKSAMSIFDLMIIDVNMPKMDGYKLVSNLRKGPDNASCPIIMVSTEAKEQDKLAALASGANFYMVKPAKVSDLLDAAKLMVGG